MANSNRQKSSFVGSETSRAEVTVYPNHESEFGVPRSTMRFTTIPVREISPTTEHLTSVSTSKQLGATAATFEVQIKSDRDLRLYIQDGDWIDITFTRHSTKHHTLRGIVMTIQQTLSATSGPTVATYTLLGSEFSLIFDEQNFWFDQVTQSDYSHWAADRIWSKDNAFVNSRPDVTVAIILRAFIQPANNTGAGFWEVPNELPIPRSSDVYGSEQIKKRSFIETLAFVSGYSHVPPRTATILPAQFTANAPSVWALAKEFADEMLCEFFVDLIDAKTVQTTSSKNVANESYTDMFIGDPYIRGPIGAGETHMAVIYRDSPFPNSVRDKDNLINAPYFKLPLVEVEPQHVLDSTLARQGSTRKNVFFFGPTVKQDWLGTFHDFQLPLADVESIRHHGIRRLDADSRYITDYAETDPSISEADRAALRDTFDGNDKLPIEGLLRSGEQINKDVWLQMAYDYRNIVRDLHCMNHLLQTGTIALNHGRPDIRIGTRFRILGKEPNQDFTCYVEDVRHEWTYTTGLRTSLVVSHGWLGTDQSYVDKLKECIARYNVFTPTFVAPEATSQEVEDRAAADLSNFAAGLQKIGNALSAFLAPLTYDAAGLIVLKPGQMVAVPENPEPAPGTADTELPITQTSTGAPAVIVLPSTIERPGTN